MNRPTVIALDTVVEDVAIEVAVAAEFGWTFTRWEGDDASLADADAVVHVRTPVDRDLIGHLTSCGAIGRYGTGLDTVDMQSASDAGIPVVNVRDYCTVEMTLHTVALALSLIRGTGPHHDNAMTQSLDWQRYRESNMQKGGYTAHVIGFGTVGQSVAKAVRSLGMQTLVTSRRDTANLPDELTAVSLDEGLSRADVLFLHRELSPETTGFVNEELLRRVGPETVLVNTARKELIDAAAVRRALEQGRLGGLGLDAHLEDGNPLFGILDRPEVLVTPHVGWYSERSLLELRQRTIANTISACEEGRRGRSANSQPRST